MINLYEVVCPTGAGHFDVEFDEAALNASKYYPHVVTFLRTGGQALNITFTLLNSEGTEWSLGSQTLSLVDVGETGITTTTTQAVPTTTSEAPPAATETATATATTTATETTTTTTSTTTTTTLVARRLAGEDPLDAALTQVLEKMGDDKASPKLRPQRALRSAARRRGSSSRSRSYYSSPPRRRSYYSSPPRRRTYSPPRRRSYYSDPRRRSYTPPPRRRSNMLDHRRRSAPPRRRSVYVAPRRRNSITYSSTYIDTPRRRYYSAAGSRWSSPATQGTSYGYTDNTRWSSTYSQSVSTPYGYTGGSAYSYSKSTMILAAGAGFVGGAVVTASTYYLYRSLSSTTCSGYSCCFGCSNACYSSTKRECTITVNDLQTQDDIMNSGFYPDDLAPFPIRVRVTSIDGDDFLEESICPPTSCTDFASCATASTTNSIWVTLTQLEELSEEGLGLSAAIPTAQPMLGLLLALCTLRAFR